MIYFYFPPTSTINEFFFLFLLVGGNGFRELSGYWRKRMDGLDLISLTGSEDQRREYLFFHQKKDWLWILPIGGGMIV